MIADARASSRSCVKAPQAVLKSAKTRTDEANLDKNTMAQDCRPHDQGTDAALCRIKASSDRWRYDLASIRRFDCARSLFLQDKIYARFALKFSFHT